MNASKQEAQLVIQEPGKPECTIPLTDFPVIIGRDCKTCDIEIRHPSVSRQHIRFMRQASGYFVEDLGSTHGTNVNDQQIRQGHIQILQHGDVIRIGKVMLVFQRSVHGHQAPGTIHLHKLEHLMQLPKFTIGRDRAHNELPLSHPSISRRHAEIQKSASGYIIRDLHSTNGTFVNGQLIRRKHQLQKGDEIRIGPFKILYGETGFVKQSTGVGYRLDALHLLRQVRGNNSQKTLKIILHDVNLSIYPREFIALVGGSGAGKSTLMKALSGVVPADQGQVFLNGDNFYANFTNYRNIIGYVPQDDIVHKQLTARSALIYAAKLRLPDNTEPEFIKQRIDDVLELVEMTEHADTPIHQLSGGQRKRVSIAVELLSDPKLFFLDEPTSGLDPGLEKKMMETLRQRADDEDGRIIILVTHATGNIHQCTHVGFMADGYLVYFGPPDEAGEFFGEQDFADIYTRLSTSSAESWASCFHNSKQYQRYVLNRQQACQIESQPVPVNTVRQKISRNASALRQFRVLVQRYFELIWRDFANLMTLLLVMPFIGVLILIMAKPYDLIGKSEDEIRIEVQEEIDEQRSAQNPAVEDEQFVGTYIVVGSAQKLLFIFALAANLLGIFAAAYEIVKEEAIYFRERMVNLKIFPYLFSKITVLGLFALLQCLLFLGVVGIRLKYPTAGILLPSHAEIYITLFLGTVASICMGLCISAVVRSSNTVIYIILASLFVQIIFAGAIFELPSIARPISYLTTTRWTLEALGGIVDIQTLKENSVSCVEFENKNTGETKAPCKRDQLKQSVDFVFHVDYQHHIVHLLSRWLALIAFACFFGGVAAWLQKRKDLIQ